MTIHLYVLRPLYITFEIFSSAKYSTKNFKMLQKTNKKKINPFIFWVKVFFCAADKRTVQSRWLRTMKSTITAEKLIICVSQCQALFGKQLAKIIKQWSQKCFELSHSHPKRCQELAMGRFQLWFEEVKLSIPTLQEGVYLWLVFSFSRKARWGQDLHHWTNSLHF